MSKLLVGYDEHGDVTNWRYEQDDDYEPREQELVVDSKTVDHRELHRKKIDVSVDPPEVVDDPDWKPRPTVEDVNRRLDTVERDWTSFQGRGPLERAKVSETSKQAFRDDRAIAADETKTTEERIDALQAQLDDLFHIVSGEYP